MSGRRTVVTLFFSLICQPIDYDGFREIMDYYLDSAALPVDLSQHLFLSFLKRPALTPSTSFGVGHCVDGAGQGGPPAQGLVPTTGSVTDSPSRLQGLAEKLHGLTERL